MPYTDFHYTPTGTGVISGKEVLEQTEDAINDLGGQISGDVQTAIDTANNALNTANTASADAQNAVNTANTAYTAATNAQNTANAAQTTASNALTAAQNAQNDVNALGNRVTTAENNITQNTTDITNLTTRMGTAEGNITTLQNDVITAQGTATSAQNTATMARQQAYVLRYSSTAITDNSTIAYSTLDNTDNIKVSDKIIDTDGKIFSIVSVDSDNSTVTVGSALIDLALDANVVHTAEINSSGIGIIEAVKEVGGVDFNTLTTQGLYGTNASGSTNNPENSPCVVQVIKRLNSVIQIASVSSSSYKSRYIRYCANITAQPPVWQSWIKFAIDNEVVHKSGDESISGNKTFSSNVNVYNSDSSTDTANIVLKNSKAERGSTTNIGEQTIFFLDKDNTQIGNIKCEVDTNGYSNLTLQCSDINDTSSGVQIRKTATGITFQPTLNSQCYLGQSIRKWYSTYTSRINGIEPSSLSLPSGNDSDKIDISSYITDLNGTPNSYTPPANGYLTFTFSNGSRVQIYTISGGGVSSNWVSGSSAGIIRGFMPVLKNSVLIIVINATTMDSFYFIPCQGNI